jgi:cytochrome c oxidase subunit II
VNVPVRMYSAIDEKDLRFHYVHEPDASRIGYEKVCKEEGKPVPDSEIVKAFEYEKGEYVYMTDEDQIARGTSPFSPGRAGGETQRGRSWRWRLSSPRACPARSLGFAPPMRRRAVVQMIVIGLLTGIATGAFTYFIPWLPDAASKEAGEIDQVYWFVAIICAVIFALVAGVSIYAGWKFRAPPDDEDDGSPIHGHTGLEIAWTAVPTVLVTAMSVFSGIVLAKIEDIPDDHRTISVTAQQFAWRFTYEDLDRTEGELVLKEDEPVRLILKSTDVIHSFWVPEFRMKQDALPDTETTTVITPTKPGRYEVICTELCGLGHSTMRAWAIVLSAEDYETWLAEDEGGGGGGDGGGSGEADGAAIFESAGCAGCHVLEAAGSEAEIGPNLDNVLSGQNEGAIRESIVDPNAEISEGYQPDVMPQDYETRLSDEELDALVRYLVESVRR